MKKLLLPAPGFSEPRPPIAPWEWIAVGLATFVGFLLRFWALDSIPPGLWYDEAIYGLDGLDVLRGANRPIFFDTFGHMREPLYLYLLAVGLAFGPVEAWTIRAVSAVIGTATIPVTWWMARELAGPRVALWTLLLFAPMRWHVHFSRTAFRVILSPLFAALTVALLARLVRRPTVAGGILLGLALGGSLYTYLSMRLFILVIIAAIALAWWTSSQRSRLLKSAAAALVTAFLVFAPLGVNFALNPQHFTGRTGEVSLFDEGRGGWSRIAMQARDIALMTTLRGDHEPKHNIPGWPGFSQAYLTTNQPQLGGAAWEDGRRLDGDSLPDVHGTGAPVFDLLTGSFFLLALALALIRGLRGCWPSGLLILWIGIGSMASVLSFGAPNMLRLLLLTPAVACILAIGVEAIWQHWSRRASRHWFAIGTALFLTWFAVGETRRHFKDWPSSPGTPGAFNTHLVEMCVWIRSHPDRPEIVVLPQYLFDTPSVRFEGDRIAGLTSDRDLEDRRQRAWLVAPVAPYPPLLLDEEEGGRAIPLQRLQTPDGQTWAIILELAPAE